MNAYLMKQESLFASQDFLSIPEHIICGTMKDEKAYKHYDYFSVTGIKAKHLELQMNRTLAIKAGDIIRIKLFGLLVSAQVIYNDHIDNKIAVYLDLAGRLRWEISHLLLLHTRYTPYELLKVGLSCSRIKAYMEFGFVENQQDYEEVLKLRRTTYAEAGKMEADRPLEQLKYFFDDYSDILVVRHNGRIIGSATLIYGDGQSQKFEVQKFMEEAGDHSFEYNDKMMEVAALCVLKDYRKTDIVHGVLEHLCFEMIKNKKEHIIVSSDDKLAKMYHSIGFEYTGKAFTQPKYQDLHMHVMIVSKDAPLKAQNVRFLHWWPLWGEIVKHMKEKSVVELGFFNNLSLSLRELSYKFVRLFA